MHAEAWHFLTTERRAWADITEMRVCEFGAHDVNGSPRRLYSGCKAYIGVDPWPGPGVDVVARAQDYQPEELFDLVITAEAMEHDPDAKGQVEAAWRILKPGGVLLVTAAAWPRRPHRCDGAEGDMNGEYYQNVKSADLFRWLMGWEDVRVLIDNMHGDIYAWAVKPCS